MADLFTSLDKWRKRYKSLPKTVRVLLTGLAFIMGPLGIVAMFTPLAVLEVGSILVFFSLTILSFEFNWAYNLLALLQRKLQHKVFRRRLTMFTLSVLATYIIVLTFKFLHK